MPPIGVLTQKESMYIPKAFNVTNQEEAITLIEENSFGDLVTYANGELSSNKVPFFFDRETNTLCGHFGKNNPQLGDIEKSKTALAIFSGAHSYVSPQWYVSENMVPTWNFQTVQVRGSIKIVDEDRLLDILEKLSAFHESQFTTQWSMDKVSPGKLDLLYKMITGFQIDISDIKFKEKMSQNRGVDDQKNVMEHLKSHGGNSARRVSEIMRKNIEQSQ